MRTRWLIVIGALSALMGAFSFWGGKIQSVEALTNGIVAVAAIVFGIIGVWMAVLHPVNELNKEELTDPDSKTDLALRIAPALEQSTYVLAGATIFRLSLAVLPSVGDKLSPSLHIKHPDLWYDAFVGIAGAVVVFIYLFVFCVLLISVLPILTMRKARKDLDFYRKEAEDSSGNNVAHR